MGMRNYTKTSLSSAGKRRAKVFMGDLVLSSGLSTSRTRNSINFLVAYASGVVVSPLSLLSLFSLSSTVLLSALAESSRSARVLARHDSHRCGGE